MNHKLTMNNNTVLFPRKGLGQKYIPRSIIFNPWEVTVLLCLGANWISDQVSTFRHHILKKMTWKKIHNMMQGKLKDLANIIHKER